jgi:hypothetical protein
MFASSIQIGKTIIGEAEAGAGSMRLVLSNLLALCIVGYIWDAAEELVERISN